MDIKKKRTPNYKPRVCVECKEYYKPNQSRQRVCPGCHDVFWKRYFAKYGREYHKRPEAKVRTAELYWLRKKKVVDIMGGACQKCGFSNPAALQIDHVNGKGNKERAGSVGDYHWNLYKSIASGNSDWKNKYQLLCANCNWIKRYENGECKTYHKEFADNSLLNRDI